MLKKLSFYASWLRDHCMPARWQQVGFAGCFVMIGLAWGLGLGSGEAGERGIFQMYNWLGFPIWWLVVGRFLNFSHRAFEVAWTRLAERRVIAFGADQPMTGGETTAFLARLPHRQKRWVVMAMLTGLALTVIDSRQVLDTYLSCGGISPGSAAAAQLCSKEEDFFTAFDAVSAYASGGLIMSAKTGLEDLISFKVANGVLAVLAYALQGVLIGMAFLILFNLISHEYELGRLGRGRRTGQVAIFLDNADPLREFGLFEWNKVLNWAFVFIAIAMIIPFVSHAVQPQGNACGRDVGQLMLQLLLPLIFLVPLGVAIFSRQILVDNAKRSLAINLRAADPALRAVLEEQFHNQKLWPFDRDLIGKTAFALIIIEYAFVASNAPALIQGFLKAQASVGFLQ